MSYEILCPTEYGAEEDLRAAKVLAPFSEVALAFVEAFSRALFDHPLARKYPELIALAYWMRRGNIEQLHRSFTDQFKGKTIQGRGQVFHITPANVDTLFVYSWFLSLLVGNSNVLRLSSGDISRQCNLLIDILNRLLADNTFAEIRRRTLLICYGHDDEITARLSASCDVRVLWGGDSTIGHIRTVPLPATATELVFADKFSLAIIDGKQFLSSAEKEKTVEGFYNDAYWFGQMACSSPRMVIWRGKGEDIARARKQFWALLEERVAKGRPQLSAADVMNKLVASCRAAMEHPGTNLTRDGQGTIHRIQVTNLAEVDEGLHCGAGLFFETEIEYLAELEPYLSRRHQTVSSSGIEPGEWREFLEQIRPRGIDRVVPMGRALDFSATWDGLDLLREFCREIVISV